MSQENDIQDEAAEEKGSSISGTLQKVIGEIEIVGGALTGDPMTQAEGEFNQEVGEIREELEDQPEETDQ